jgi:hypothetical protein
LAPYGLFNPIELAISSADSGMRTAGVLALSSIADMDPLLLRSHILSQQPRDNGDEDDYPGHIQLDLLQCIINRIISNTDPGLQYQYCETLKLTLADRSQTPVPLESTAVK